MRRIIILIFLLNVAICWSQDTVVDYPKAMQRQSNFDRHKYEYLANPTIYDDPDRLANMNASSQPFYHKLLRVIQRITIIKISIIIGIVIIVVLGVSSFTQKSNHFK